MATLLFCRSTLILFALLHFVSSYIDATGNVIIPGGSSYNGLNLVPQMGWDNWNPFQCNFNESLLLQTAQRMVEYGLRDLGYKYIVLDDCWSSGRNETGFLIENPKMFPRGMKYLGDTLHNMGMKLGMSSSAGVFTCGRLPGSLGNEQKDAEYFAAVGADYLKYDNCYNQGQTGTAQLSFDRYNVMSQALNKTGRPIVYSLDNWGEDDSYDWAFTIANSGRMSGGVYDSFNRPDSRCMCKETIGCARPGNHCSVMNILNKGSQKTMAAIQSCTVSGYFNDMDMLEVGNGGQTDSEYVVHFSMWAMNASPLLIGTNVLALSPANLAIYSNPAVIALNQDPSASAAVRVWQYSMNPDENGEGEIALWTRSLKNGDQAIALLNAGNTSMMINATLQDIFLDSRTAGSLPSQGKTWDVYDLWANRMSNGEAESIINGTAVTINTNGTLTRYNATATSYAQGLINNDTALYGSKVGSIAPSGTWAARIERHSVALYRLRQGGASMRRKDEL